MTEHKELAKDFVIAMIQRGYFDKFESIDTRAEAVVKAYRQFEALLALRSTSKDLQKEAIAIRQGI